MNHEEAINTVAALPLSVNLGGEVGVIITKDVDGFEVTATNHSTNKKRTLRYDAVKGFHGRYVRYDVSKKPTTRIHEMVFVGDDPTLWVFDNLDYFTNLVKEG